MILARADCAPNRPRARASMMPLRSALAASAVTGH